MKKRGVYFREVVGVGEISDASEDTKTEALMALRAILADLNADATLEGEECPEQQKENVRYIITISVTGGCPTIAESF